MSGPDDRTVSRKGDHVDIILEGGMSAKANAWDDVALVHEALPEADLDAVELSTTLLNRELDLPVMVASMTGGYPGAKDINERLAAAAAEHGMAMGVGSQRAMLTDPSQAETFTVVTEYDIPFVAANIGAPQLITQGDDKPLTTDEILHLIDAIDADALIVHLNYLQELVQPEGDTQAAGVEQAIEHLVTEVPGPVIAKETGAGMHRVTAQRLVEAGCAALDVGGLSGTTFAAVETVRAEQAGSESHVGLGERFRDWGVPTPVAVVEALHAECEVIATGGVRDGLDVAAALALGAQVAGMASGVLKPASEGAHELERAVAAIEDQLRTALMLTGCEHVDELTERPVVIGGTTRTWLEALGQDVARFGADRLAR